MRTSFLYPILLTNVVVFVSPYLQAQDPWNVPWINIGDSSYMERYKEVIVTGKLVVKGSNEPIAGASISADSFKFFDYTDNKGDYKLELPAGRYRIKVRSLGMKILYYRLRILSDGEFNFEMEPGFTGLDEVVITARKVDSNVKESTAGMTKLNIQDIKTLPTMMGEVDIIKSLQLLPGVSSVGEGSSGLNVRGGRTDQNLTLLNDVPVFNVSHALGFISAFNQDIIQNFSLYKGNVPANQGGRASSVLEINTRRGDFDKWKFQGGVGAVSSRFTAEGPINKQHTSLLIAGRISHANWVLNKVSDPNVRNSSLFFYDGFAALSHRISSSTSLDLSYYGSQDFFKFSDQFGYEWKTSIVNAKWQGLTNRKVSPSVTASYGSYRSKLIDPSGIDAAELTNTLHYVQVKPTINYSPNEKHNAVAGISGIAYLPKQEELNPYQGNPAIVPKKVDKNSGLEASIFANDDYQISENLSVSLGLRYSHYMHMGPDTVYTYTSDLPKSTNTIIDTSYYKRFESIKSFGGFEPRISARINITQHQSVKVSYNRMRQYIHQISTTTAPTPVDLWQVSNEYLPPQIADNFSLGYFLNIKDNLWETSAEVFYKDMQNLVEYKNFPVLFLNRHLETELLSGKGRAYGAELYIRRLKGWWTGWISYTYSQTQVQVASQNKSESINAGEWYPSNYNKPHILNMVVNRRLSKGGAISFILAYNSGRPLTAIESSYIAGGAVVPIYSNRNQYTIPDYIRFDFSFTIGNVINKLDDSLVFSVYNLFGRENAYSVFYQRPASTYLIPKPYQLSILGSPLPSLTYNFKF